MGAKVEKLKNGLFRVTLPSGQFNVNRHGLVFRAEPKPRQFAQFDISELFAKPSDRDAARSAVRAAGYRL